MRVTLVYLHSIFPSFHLSPTHSQPHLSLVNTSLITQPTNKEEEKIEGKNSGPTWSDTYLFKFSLIYIHLVV